MQGVEILTSAQIATEWRMDWITFVAMGILMFLLCLAAGTRDMIEWQDLIPYGIMGVFLGVVVGFGFGHVLCGVPTNYETQYKVTVSDQVSMNEFYEHYEVIDQDEKIFTVREKKDGQMD